MPHDMGTPKDRQAPAGMRKPHRVRHPDGTEGTMTQEEWQNRDKAAGIVRIDEAGEELPDDDPAA